MSKELVGSRWRRANGRWTVQGRPAWHEGKQRLVRPNLGMYATEGEAIAAQVEYTARINAKRFSVTEAEIRRTLLGKYLEEWKKNLRVERDDGHIAERTYMDYLSVTNNHLIPHLRTISIGDINANAIRQWLDVLRKKGLADRTIDKAYRTLRRAIGDSGIPINPVSLPKRHRPRGGTMAKRDYPAPETVGTFIRHLLDCDRPTRFDLTTGVMLAAYSGLRRAEICGLVWSDLDFDGSTLTVERSLQIKSTDQIERPRTALHVKAPKSEYGYRTIGLVQPMISRLKSQRLFGAEERLRAGDRYVQRPLDHDFVLRGDHWGKPLHPDRLTVMMKREWDHAGLRPITTLHGLRHAVASTLIQHGATITDVAAHLGDKIQTIQLFYQHELDAAARRSTVNAMIEDAYGG